MVIQAEESVPLSDRDDEPSWSCKLSTFTTSLALGLCHQTESLLLQPLFWKQIFSHYAATNTSKHSSAPWTRAVQGPLLLTACAFGSQAGGRTPFMLVHRSSGAMVQEEAKSSDFLPKGQLLQTDQTESCKFSPTSPLKLVRNHILFPVKLPRKTSNGRPRISATEGSRLPTSKAGRTWGPMLSKQQGNR